MNNFTFFNYLPRHSIQISYITTKDTYEKILVERLDPQSKTSIPSFGYVSGGMIIVRAFMGEDKPISIFPPFILTDKSINTLHIGMVTSQNNVITSSYGNVMKDMDRIRIHNKTMIPLFFNNHIYSPPDDLVTYLGREANGVNVGFELRNTNGILNQKLIYGLFEPFIISEPVTDIFYGLVSANKVSLYNKISYLRE
jgi:hypothetical protein